jgi:hypothetical protein
MREAKVASEPEVLIGWFRDLGFCGDDADWAGGRPAVAVAICGQAECGIGGRIARTRHVRDAFDDPRTFAIRIRELVAGLPMLSTITEALLAARGTLFEQ